MPSPSTLLPRYLMFESNPTSTRTLEHWDKDKRLVHRSLCMARCFHVASDDTHDHMKAIFRITCILICVVQPTKYRYIRGPKSKGSNAQRKATSNEQRGPPGYHGCQAP